MTGSQIKIHYVSKLKQKKKLYKSRNDGDLKTACSPALVVCLFD